MDFGTIIEVSLSLLLVVFGIYVTRSKHPFETEKGYQKRKAKQIEEYNSLCAKYPTLISRLSYFFNIPEDQIKNELKDIFSKE